MSDIAVVEVYCLAQFNHNHLPYHRDRHMNSLQLLPLVVSLPLVVAVLLSLQVWNSEECEFMITVKKTNLWIKHSLVHWKDINISYS